MGDFVLVMSLDGELVSLSREQGRVKWIARLPAFEDEDDRDGRIRWAGPILASSHIILRLSDGRLVTVDPTNGEVGDFVKLGEAVNVTPVLADGTLYRFDR